MLKTVITYGTFDLLHYGHIELLRRAKDYAHGGQLIVGLSTDDFNAAKGKRSALPYRKRKELLASIKYVDRIIPEKNWAQKVSDIKRLGIDSLIMGDDWRAKFDDLADYCEVVYLTRTPTISSTLIKEALRDETSLS